jgi:hypothetical protein
VRDPTQIQVGDAGDVGGVTVNNTTSVEIVMAAINASYVRADRSC